MSHEDSQNGQLSLIQTKGTLDWAYPAFILASTAAVMDKKVELFFSFYGLNCLLKDVSNLKVSPLGNPGMIIKSPYGPDWFKKINLNQALPGFIWGLPGMTSLATYGFKQQLASQNQLSIEELRTLCLDLGVKFTACQMTMDLMGLQEKDLIEGVEFAGAATYFAHSPDQQSLFI